MSAQNRSILVVIGSGWAGFYIAQHIDTRLYNLTVISPRNTCSLTPLLASAAYGIIPFGCAEEPIRAKNRDCNFVRAEAVGIDFDRKVVQRGATIKENGISKPQFEVQYEYLVICQGYNPGVEEHALFVKHVDDAIALRTTLFDRLEGASLPHVSTEERKRLLHIVIVGGGPTGVELTAEISDLAQHEIKDIYPSAAQYLCNSIYDVADHILGAHEQELYSYATKHLQARGIEVTTGSIIEKVDSQVLYLKGRDSVPYGILLWVAGNKSIPFVDHLNVKRTQGGLRRILADGSLRVKKNDDTTGVYLNVFALGDAADVAGSPLPTTAEVAVQKAHFLVQHLNRTPRRSQLNMPTFTYQQKGLVTYIGNRDGIRQGWSADSPYSGSQAWLSWRSGSFTWSRTWRSWANVGWAMLANLVFGKNPMGM